MARSQDGGKTFAAPIDVETGDALQGRVDVAMDADATWLVWLREDAKGQAVEVARFPAKGGAVQRTEIARLSGRGRGTGFPKIAVEAAISSPALVRQRIWPEYAMNMTGRTTWSRSALP